MFAIIQSLSLDPVMKPLIFHSDPMLCILVQWRILNHNKHHSSTIMLSRKARPIWTIETWGRSLQRHLFISLWVFSTLDRRHEVLSAAFDPINLGTGTSGCVFLLVKNYLPEFSRPLDIMGTMIDKGAVVGLLVFDEAISFNCFLKGRYLCSLLKGCSNKHEAGG